MNNPQIGQQVKCNGYEGAIVVIHTGQLAGMVDVRLDRGTVCVSYSELEVLS